MAKKSKLFAALDAYKGKDYEQEKQKKFQKKAVKRKAARPELLDQGVLSGSNDERKSIDASIAQLEMESEGWESDESEAATKPPVYFDFPL